jgi:hypothetical protein
MFLNNMLILLHVIIALTSIGFSTYLFFSPSKTGFYTAYSLIGGTLASGTYLVVSTHQPLLPSCIAGLAYCLVVVTAVGAAHRKFASQRIKIEK